MARKKKNYAKHYVRLSGCFSWMEPYLQVAGDMGVPIHKLKSIRGYYVPPEKLERHYGITRKDTNGTYTISMLRLRQDFRNKQGRIKVRGYIDCNSTGCNMEFTIQVLAHELAHMVHWDHTPDRYIFEAKLMQKFARLSKKLGHSGY